MATDRDLAGACWRKSSYSGDSGGDCVECAPLGTAAWRTPPRRVGAGGQCAEAPDPADPAGLALLGELTDPADLAGPAGPADPAGITDPTDPAARVAVRDSKCPAGPAFLASSGAFAEFVTTVADADTAAEGADG
ncbi:DUF397 domain-containing protein [Streptomyces laurentii]|uniref:DUF397 domain-containing protein n=1 Tax=Streptomyces laurentii TaxID=39478 RepID=UPI003673B9BE